EPLGLAEVAQLDPASVQDLEGGWAAAGAGVEPGRPEARPVVRVQPGRQDLAAEVPALVTGHVGQRAARHLGLVTLVLHRAVVVEELARARCRRGAPAAAVPGRADDVAGRDAALDRVVPRHVAVAVAE